MKTEYIDQIYKDFNSKTETVLKYLSILQEKTVSTTSDVVNFIKLYETLYTSLVSSQGAIPIPTDTQFSLEQQNPIPSVNNAGEVKKLSTDIATQTPLIEYKYEDLLKNLQYLTQAYQNYQDIASKIVEAWDNALQSLES